MPYAFGERLLSGNGQLPPTLWRSSPPGVDLIAWLLPNPTHPLWRDTMIPLIQRWAGRGDAYPEFVASQSCVALGVIALAWLAGWRPSRAWLAFTGSFGLLALGPFLHVAGVNTQIPMPWSVLPIRARSRDGPLADTLQRARHARRRDALRARAPHPPPPATPPPAARRDCRRGRVRARPPAAHALLRRRACPLRHHRQRPASRHPRPRGAGRDTRRSLFAGGRQSADTVLPDRTRQADRGGGTCRASHRRARRASSSSRC